MREFLVKLIDCCSFMYWLWQHLCAVFEDGVPEAFLRYERKLYYWLLCREINREVLSYDLENRFLCQMDTANVYLYPDGTTNLTDLFDKVDILEAEKYAYCVLAAAEIQRSFEEDDGG